MKKLLWIIIVVLVIIAAVAAYFSNKNGTIAGTDGSPQKTVHITQATKTFTSKKACDVLTLEDARKILGDQAQNNSTVSTSSESNDAIVSTCVYTINGTTLDDTKFASILVHSAKTEAGAQSNESGFNTNRPIDAQDVNGYGDKAYWNPQMGQLNILKGNNWYMISNGPLRVTDHSLDAAKAAANIVTSRL